MLQDCSPLLVYMIEDHMIFTLAVLHYQKSSFDDIKNALSSVEYKKYKASDALFYM